MRLALSLLIPLLVMRLAACERGDAPAVSPTGEASTPTPTPPPVEQEPEGDEAPEEAELADAGQVPEAEGAEPAPKVGELIVSKEACTSDADCVKASCCHANACVAAANAPSCAGKACTMDCRGGTIDCGGSCLCHEGFCAAQLNAGF